MLSLYHTRTSFFQIIDLLVPSNFPKMNSTELAIKRSILNETLASYCSNLPGCGIPDPDRAPVLIDTVSLFKAPILTLLFEYWYKNLAHPNLGTQCINPLFVTNSSWHSPHCFLISSVLDRQQLVEWSVVEPTWLPSSNREASLCGNERLKDQLKKSG